MKRQEQFYNKILLQNSNPERGKSSLDESWEAQSSARGYATERPTRVVTEIEPTRVVKGVDPWVNIEESVILRLNIEYVKYTRRV